MSERTDERSRRRSAVLPAALAALVVLAAACTTRGPLAVDQVQAGDRVVTVHTPADCLDWDPCGAPSLTVVRGMPVLSGVTVGSPFAVSSQPVADWGVEADASGRRIVTDQVAPGRYVVSITTASGIAQFRLEVSS